MVYFSSFKRDLVEIYENRNIIRSLVSKNLFGKYKNSYLGFAWNFIVPLFLLLMYMLIYTGIRGDGGIEHKWIFVGVAIFPFHFMTSCIVGGTGVFTGNVGMIKKMYFPREILILSRAISSMIVCFFGIIAVFVIMAIYGYPLNPLLWLIMIPVLILVFIFGVGCLFFLSSITVYVRDIQYFLGCLGIALFIATPMRYMASDASGILGTVIWFNPLTYYVEVIHDLLYWGVLPKIEYIVLCLIISVSTLIIGYLTFRLLKRGFVRRL